LIWRETDSLEYPILSAQNAERMGHPIAVLSRRIKKQVENAQGIAVGHETVGLKARLWNLGRNTDCALFTDGAKRGFV
jgi:hypothetical protein